MQNPRGRVLSVDLAKPLADVEVAAPISCARCASGKGCGAGLLGANGESRRIEAQIAAGITVRPGDEVRIELASGQLLNAALLVYGLPLAGALAGAGIAYAVGLGDLNAALAGLGGIAAGMLLARSRLRVAGICEFTPIIVERIVVERTGH